MEQSQYTPMMASHEGPNPLRPYYRPPSIGERISDSMPSSSLGNSSTSSASKAAASPSFGSSARDMLSDLNYNDILGEGASTTGESLRSLADQALWKYSSIFMAQPFEVAKMVLQVKRGSTSVPEVAIKQRYQRRSLGNSSARDYGDEDDDEDDDDEPSYFTSAAPQRGFTDYTSQSESGRSRSSASRRSAPIRPPKPVYKLELRKADALLEVLGQSWAREGVWGVW
jgi:fusion and transport protein UGO1